MIVTENNLFISTSIKWNFKNDSKIFLIFNVFYTISLQFFNNLPNDVSWVGNSNEYKNAQTYDQALKTFQVFLLMVIQL